MSSSKAFDEKYAALNKAQRDAVDSIDGPVMVIAGPGTGKTTILTLRIANILRLTDTPANGILAITYTDAGVRAMREKLQKVIGDRAHEVMISTFHGFAASVIAEYPDHFMHIQDLKQMTDIDQETMVRDILEEPRFSDLRPPGRPAAYVGAILKSIDDSKREAMTPAMVREHATKRIADIHSDESSISSRGATKGQLKAEAKEEIEKCERTKLFADVYERYDDLKGERRLMDFNDLLFYLLEALRKDELLLRLLQERFLYIHVDEHQDTNDAQNFIVGLIAEFFEVPNVFIVGDEKQAIYRFQGASVENFLLLQKKWPAMKVIQLDMNYRSHQDILDASFGMIEKNYEGDESRDLRVKLKSGQSNRVNVGGNLPVSVAIGENAAAMESELVKGVSDIKDSGESVAIIVRKNRDLDRVIRLLEANGIPVSSERSVDIFAHPAGRIFFDMIEYMSDPTKIDALARTIVVGLWGLTFDDGAAVISKLRSGQSFGLEKVIPEIVHLKRAMLNDSPVGFLVSLAGKSGYLSLVARDPAYVHVWRGIIALAESLCKDDRMVDPSVLMRGLLSYRISAESKTIKVPVGAPDVPVKAMTAHGSKGLEFDHVFIPYATEESWVGKNRGNSFVLPKKRASDHDIRDSRRLFYVAVTRARKDVRILSLRENADGSLLDPVRFIDEIMPSGGDVESTIEELPRVQAEVISADSEINIDERLVDIAKRSIVEHGLSVTALNHFIKCPNTFLYQSVLKMPQAPSVATEKGTAMHEAISLCWNVAPKSAKEYEAIMTESVKAYFDKSLLSLFEKHAALKNILEDMPAVARSLEPHFAAKSGGAQIFAETWIRSELTVKYFEKSITVPLHGKVDAALSDSCGVSIFDYKTKQAMSTAAIKGETKGSDGGYWRQLVFYKMLASDDKRWKGKLVEPALVFVSPDSKGRCPTISLPIADSDIVRVKEEVQSLVNAIWSGEISRSRCDEEKCEWCGLRSLSFGLPK